MGMRRRKRRTRSDEGKLRFDRFDSWEMEHHPNTFEGQWEGMGRLAYGLHRRRREGRPTYGMWLVALAILLPMAVILVVGLVDLLIDLL